MAPRKAKASGNGTKSARSGALATAAAREPGRARSHRAGSNSNRLLREAAWSRMFGRVEIEEPVHPLARRAERWCRRSRPTCARRSRAFRSIGMPWRVPGRQRIATRPRSAAAAVRRRTGEPELPDPSRRQARRAAPAAARRTSRRRLRHGARVPHPEPAARCVAVRAARAVPGRGRQCHRRAVPDHRISARPGDPRAHPAGTGRPPGSRRPAVAGAARDAGGDPCGGCRCGGSGRSRPAGGISRARGERLAQARARGAGGGQRGAARRTGRTGWSAIWCRTARRRCCTTTSS